MKSFSEYYIEESFNPPYLVEGGNVQIGDYAAERIDLSKINRDSIITRLNRVLSLINLKYQKEYGVPLWNDALFKSKEFLSGSAFHFFNKAISTPEFVQYKNTVGDIDTQVDKSQEHNIKNFLTKITGQVFNYVKFIGFKSSAGQFITLWAFSNPAINIQIDLELVDFKDNKPTEWSQFSHSSSWDDMKEGVKGVFQKYLLRAFTTKTLKDLILLKGKKEVPTEVKSTDLAFSVTQGLRQKITPVLDNGIQRHINGLPVYKEIPTGKSTYVNDLKIMFNILFGVVPNTQELNMFSSFVGGLKLAKKYFTQQQQQTLILGFANTLWGIGAQGLYRNNPDLDKHEKEIAFNLMIKTLNVKYDTITINNLKTNYYKTYKLS